MLVGVGTNFADVIVYLDKASNYPAENIGEKEETSVKYTVSAIH